jgi:dephospho-CoA kinase
MKLFGITGGVGMGKSTVAQILEKSGVVVVDTDVLSHRLTESGQPALAEISAKFGPTVLQADGSLNRKELARIVFSDDKARASLEAILHPKIRALWEAEVARWRNEGRERGAVVIPLLFETASEGSFDATICVACSAATQEKRLRERGWTPEQIARRVAAQWPVEQKIAKSDFVVWTDTVLEAAEAQLARIIDSADTPQKTPACA